MGFDGFVWARSADKHGIARADAIHAIVDARVFVPDFDRARVDGKGWAHLWIGCTRDRRQNLEVMAHFNGAAHVVEVFHVMPLREKTYDRAIEILRKRAGR